MPIANYTTDVSVSTTVGDITASLARRGVNRISTVYDDAGDPAGLEFTMRTEFGPRDFALPVRTEGVLAALQRDKVAAKYLTREHAAKVAWRIAREWLRAQSALIDAGLASLDEVMFPWMLDYVTATVPVQTAFEAYRIAQEAIES